jgi:hypothetical protein
MKRVFVEACPVAVPTTGRSYKAGLSLLITAKL